ncbi:hypothetical protein DUNSADRAFT_699 [Dunaliella salina]|uniref:Encoded protein n=1 Tax=Dunaliella salina TaxID=3046 RepID=A0ABQ7FYI3_DUNSA|nr:hypothetical protein DUNSADRAFT_699 [Dunaliella salina]|eukprot:KAF5827420.1 hypothetical protein DUNSADRAFT_699 [Dunaliella salina]
MFWCLSSSLSLHSSVKHYASPYTILKMKGHDQDCSSCWKLGASLPIQGDELRLGHPQIEQNKVGSQEQQVKARDFPHARSKYEHHLNSFN